MKHLNRKVLFKVCDRLDVAKGSLAGLSGLLTQDIRASCFENGELIGLGQLLNKIGEEIGILEDILRSGEDSTIAVQRQLFLPTNDSYKSLQKS
jgi:hypothetical protein